MKKTYVVLVNVLAIVLSGCISVRGAVVEAKYHDPIGHLRHIVMFTFVDGATPEQQKAVEDAMGKLQDSIPEVQNYEWGTEISGRNMNKGLTHCALFTFENEADRDTYIEHPSHKDFVAFAKPLMKDLFVFDYWAKE